MPRSKQRQKASKGGGNNAEAQSSPAVRSSKRDEATFPPHLLRNNSNNSCNLHYDGASPPSGPEALVPNAVYVARHALSSAECREWISYAEGGGGGGWEGVSHPATEWIAHRECGRMQKNDWDMSHRLYERIRSTVHAVASKLDIFDKASLPSNAGGARRDSSTADSSDDGHPVPRYRPVTCNPNLRLYKYTKGMSFGKHVDGSDKVDTSKKAGCTSPPPSLSNVKGAQTEVTVLFYLSTCRGGATRFHLPRSGGGGGKRKKGKASDGSSDGVAFVPEEGAVLLHVHGDRCLEHEGMPVLDGVKYVLRTDVVYGIM